jgi:hypothetical protein
MEAEIAAMKALRRDPHLERARAFLQCYAAYISPLAIEPMARQLALVLAAQSHAKAAEP